MVVDRSFGKGWFYLVTVYGDPPTHYYFATFDEAETFCNDVMAQGKDVTMYDLNYYKNIGG